MKTILSFLITITIFASSCKKNKLCATSINLTATTVTPTEGDDIVFTTTKESDNDVLQWNGPGLNIENQSNTLRIDDIKLSQSGTYYCTKGNTECGSVLRDSIIIDVKLKQETPPCTPTNNVVNCSNIPSPTFTSVTRGYSSTWNAVNLTATGTFGYPPFEVLFNSYNGNTEPKDGTYITKNIQSFSPLDEPNLISISFIYGSNYYHCRADNKVYVTHANGKLQVTFCNLEFATGVVPPTTCSGKITQL
jgi:hypothetical protein